MNLLTSDCIIIYNSVFIIILLLSVITIFFNADCAHTILHT